MTILTNIVKSAVSALTKSPKHFVQPSSGGQIFYGWMFLFTLTTAGQIQNVAKHDTALINVPKH